MAKKIQGDGKSHSIGRAEFGVKQFSTAFNLIKYYDRYDWLVSKPLHFNVSGTGKRRECGFDRIPSERVLGRALLLLNVSNELDD